VDAELGKKYDLSNGVTNTFAISNLQNDKANKTDVYTKTEADTLLAGKTSTGVTTALTGRVSSAEDNITLLSSTLGNNYYNKTTSDARFKPIS
jgi:hypothetical protein